jgi:hypothetical protein
VGGGYGVGVCVVGTSIADILGEISERRETGRRGGAARETEKEEERKKRKRSRGHRSELNCVVLEQACEPIVVLSASLFVGVLLLLSLSLNLVR